MNESEIQDYLYRHFFSGRQYGIPNIFLYEWESDFLSVTRAGYVHEYEIKITKSDFNADSGKVLKHQLLEAGIRDLNDYEQSYVSNQEKLGWNMPIFMQPKPTRKYRSFCRFRGKKFLSIEPLLGEINFGVDLLQMGNLGLDDNGFNRMATDNINAVILGGETGPGARPMHPEWVRSVRNQCAAAGVPFFFKSWGKIMPAYEHCFGKKDISPRDVLTNDFHRWLDGHTHDELPWNHK